MNKRAIRYLLFFSLLVAAPFLREMFFGAISDHHQPFHSYEDILHTLSEMGVMAVLAGILIGLDLRFSRDKNKELRETQAVAIETLASLAEYRDAETSQHLIRIRELVTALATQLMESSPYGRYMRSQNGYIEDLAHASVLHDIGKIAVPDTILLKPGSLTETEFEVIKTHTTIGADILVAADNQFRERIGRRSYLALAQSLARWHHERWDGSGYPDGLGGEDIPLAARMVAVCDVYDAVTSDRVYKKAWPHDRAVELIRDGSGSQFDPVIVEQFLAIESRFKEIKEKHQNE